MKQAKSEVITFKVDAALSEALKDIPNRSRFIRSAVLAALDNVCPLCQGAGFLTPSQKQHWDRFAEGHTLRRCHDCHEIYLTCSHEPTKAPER
jgi:hypothetical protein